MRMSHDSWRGEERCGSCHVMCAEIEFPDFFSSLDLLFYFYTTTTTKLSPISNSRALDNSTRWLTWFNKCPKNNELGGCVSLFFVAYNNLHFSVSLRWIHICKQSRLEFENENSVYLTAHHPLSSLISNM